MRKLRGLASVLATVLLMGSPTRAQEEIILNVGVDPDAAPFSHRLDRASYFNPSFAVPGPLSEAGFRGYVVQVCDAAMHNIRVRNRNVTFNPVEVTTSTRFGNKALGIEREDWQILCDPASMTSLRAALHEPTLPIYLSGVGFARLEDIPPGQTCQTIAGVASNTTTAHAGVLAIIEAGVIPRWNKDLSVAVASDEGNVRDCGEGKTVPIVAFKETHTELANALCRGEILYYIGDMEIVRATLARKADCESVEFSDTTFGDERYTIFTHSENLTAGQAIALNAFRAELSRLALQDSSSLLKAYEAFLGNNRKSRKLSAFYWGVVGAFELR